MKVSGHGKPRQLAGAIAGCLRAGENCVLLPVSAAAVLNAVLAAAIATEFLKRKVADGFLQAPVWLRTLPPTRVSIGPRSVTCTRLEVLAVDSSHLEVIQASGIEQIPTADLPGAEAIVGLIQSQLGNSRAIDLICVGAGAVYDAVTAIHLACSTQLQLRIFPTFDNIEVDGERQAKVVLRVCVIE